MEPSTYISSERTPAELCAALVRAGFQIGPWSDVRRTALDTFDGRLHGAGLRLELREGQARELVLSGGGPATAHLTVGATPKFSTDLPRGPLRSRLAPLLDVRALLPVLVVTGRRCVARREDSRGKRQVVVILHDSLAVEGAARLGPAWAAEVEALRGYPKAAGRTREVLRATGLGAHRGDLIDHLALVAGVDLRGHTGSPTIALASDTPALEGYRRVLAHLAEAVGANWQGTVDDVDPEFLHEFRVAVRRTRSVLAQAKSVLPPEVRTTYRDAFGWLGAATGPARDLDVYVIEWESYVEPLGPEGATALRPVLDRIIQMRHDEHVSLTTALRSPRYSEIMSGWEEWLHGGATRSGGREALRPIGRIASGRIAAAQARVLRQGRAITEASAPEELHELRKDAKRLRYLVECFGGTLPSAPRKSFVQRLKSLQDNLGEHQDTEVHAAQLRDFSRHMFTADPVPDALVAMGQLAERFEIRRRAARQEFARRFAAYDSRETARILDRLLKAAAGR